MKKPSYSQSESFERYVKEVLKYPLLSKEEERELFDRFNDLTNSELERKKAKEKLINSNLRFVIKMARYYKSHSFLLEDLVSSGNIGLIKAVENYDYTRGKSFVGYAKWHIQRKIISTMVELNPGLVLSHSFYKLLGRISGLEGLAKNKEQLAELSKSSSKKIEKVLKHSYTCVSLNQQLDEGENSEEFMYYLKDESFSPENSAKLYNDEIFGSIYPFLRNKKEKRIFEMRYGLDGAGYKTLEEVGLNMGLTKERVRQIEANLFKRIKKDKQPREKLYFYYKNLEK